jgi:hypothetical protein
MVNQKIYGVVRFQPTLGAPWFNSTMQPTTDMNWRQNAAVRDH